VQEGTRITTTITRLRPAFSALFAFALALLAAVAAPALARAAPGGLDRSFSGNGKVTTAFGTLHPHAESVAIDSRGRIVAAGGNDGGRRFALARYKPNGSLDRSFSRNGRVKTHFGHRWSFTSANSVATDPRGRIVAAGTTGKPARHHLADLEFAVARYKPNGRLDRSFSGNGKVTTNFVAGGDASGDGAESVAIDSRGRIVAAGYAAGKHSRKGEQFALVRYKRNGGVDRSFSQNGRVTTDFDRGSDNAHAVAIDSRGRIVVAGSAWISGEGDGFALARYKPNGHLDRSFAHDGRVTTSFDPGYGLAYSVAIDSRGRIVAAGTDTDSSFALARYRPNGTLDDSFGTGGKVTTGAGAAANSVAIDSLGRIVAAGRDCNFDCSSYDFALARYRPTGSLDTSFGAGGTVTTDFAGGSDEANSVEIDSRDRIVAAGGGGRRNDFALARYHGYPQRR
jgi:uncharacterized delta-60 repeat protein